MCIHPVIWIRSKLNGFSLCPVIHPSTKLNENLFLHNPANKQTQPKNLTSFQKVMQGNTELPILFFLVSELSLTQFVCVLYIRIYASVNNKNRSQKERLNSTLPYLPLKQCFSKWGAQRHDRDQEEKWLFKKKKKKKNHNLKNY